MKTLRQISEKYNITREGLNKRIDKIPEFRKKYMIKKHGMWLIQDKAVHLINHKRQMIRPKHYKQSIDHIPTRYDLQQALKHEQKRNDKLLSIVQSQQKTIRQQTNNQQTLPNNHKKATALPDETFDEYIARQEIRKYKKHGRWYRFWHNIE